MVRLTPALNEVINKYQFLTFKFIFFFYVKKYPNLSQFFFIEEYQFRGMSFVVDIFWKFQFSKHFLYQNHAYLLIAWFRADVDLTIFFMKKFYENLFHEKDCPTLESKFACTIKQWLSHIYFFSVLNAKNNSVPKLFCHYFVSYSCDKTLIELD